LHQPECVDLRPTGAEPPGCTACAQLRENEFTGDCTFPDESVPLASRERAPAEIAGEQGTPTRLRGCGPCFRACGKKGRAAEAAPPDLRLTSKQSLTHTPYEGWMFETTGWVKPSNVSV
jgi:hypothetical protein